MNDSIPEIKPPGSAKLAFTMWIALSIVVTAVAIATIDPGMLGIENAHGLVTTDKLDRSGAR